MKKLLTTILFGLAVFGFAPAVVAAEQGTADDAVALVKKAIAHIKSAGKEAAFNDFNNSPQFKNRDLYIFVVDLNGFALAHGANAKLIGKPMMELKDADGKYFVKEFVELGKTKGKGWTDYKWPNPVTKAIEPKSTYVEKLDDVLVLCGIYKK